MAASGQEDALSLIMALDRLSEAELLDLSHLLFVQMANRAAKDKTLLTGLVFGLSALCHCRNGRFEMATKSGRLSTTLLEAS